MLGNQGPCLWCTVMKDVTREGFRAIPPTGRGSGHGGEIASDYPCC